MDLALNNLQRLICHKTQTANLPTNSQIVGITAWFNKDSLNPLFNILIIIIIYCIYIIYHIY